MADPLLINFIRKDGKGAASGVIHYRPGTPGRGGGATSGRGFLAEYDEAIKDARLQTVEYIAKVVEEAGYGPVGADLAQTIRIMKDLV